MAASDFEPPPPPLADLDDELASLCQDVIAAATDASLWVPWLRRVARTFDATLAHVAQFDFKRGIVMLHAFGSDTFPVPDVILRDYEDAAPIDERAAFVVAFPGRTIATEDIDEEFQSRIPTVQIAPPELGRMMLVSDVAEPYMGFVSVLRHKDSPRFPAHQRARMAALGVWFSRAMAIFRAVEAATKPTHEMIGALNAMSSPMALVGGDGGLKGINAAARAWLGLAPDRSWGPGPAWGRAAEDAAANGHAVLSVTRSDGQARAARVTLLPGSDRSCLVEFDIDPGSTVLALDRFCSHYGLTRAERQLLDCLVSGIAPSAAAQTLGRSKETIKTQLRMIREKTGIRSQVALVSSFNDFAASIQDASQAGGPRASQRR